MGLKQQFFNAGGVIIKVLFTGTYRQNDGWGRSSQDYLRALKLVPGIELESKPIMLSGRIDPAGKTAWADLETADIGKPDVCIYHAPPQFSDPSSSCYNIAIFHLETCNIHKSSYMRNMDNFNEFWVATKHELETLVAAKFPPEKCKVAPMPLNFDALDRAESYDPEELKDEYVFLYVGDLTERKNVHSAVLAFWRSFTTKDKVSLVLKITIPPSQTKKSAGEHAIEWIERLKANYRLYENPDEYPEVKIIADYISDDQLIALQSRADCFVMPSRGESTCRPLLESYYLGKPVIVTEGIGCYDEELMTEGVDVVQSMSDPCRAQSAPMPGVYSSWETWKNVNIVDFGKAMNFMYATHLPLDPMTLKARQEKIKNVYSYQSVARLIENQLRGLHVSTT